MKISFIGEAPDLDLSPTLNEHHHWQNIQHYYECLQSIWLTPQCSSRIDITQPNRNGFESA